MNIEKEYQRKLKAVIKELKTAHHPAVAKEMQLQGHDITSFYLNRITPRKEDGFVKIKRPSVDRVEALYDCFFG